MSDNNRMVDSLAVELRGIDIADRPTVADHPSVADRAVEALGEALLNQLDGPRTPGLGPIPGRPGVNAAKGAWVDYVVALGADLKYLTEATEHFDDDAGVVVIRSALTKDELIELAGRLDGTSST